LFNPKTNPIQTQFQKLFDAQNQDFIKIPVQKILELTFGFTTICCGQAYEKTPKYENKKVDNLSDGC
jgi:hypothetical protein